MDKEAGFLSFLDELICGTPLDTQEIINLFLPFLAKINELHENGKVSPLKDIYEIKIHENALSFDLTNVEEAHENIDRLNNLLSKPGSEDLIEHIQGYTCWEFENFGFYDALSDIFICGLMLASVSLHLNFRKKEDFERFTENLSKLNSVSTSLHPVINECIKRMVKLDRNEREGDLESIIFLLTHYKDQVIDDLNFEEESKDKTPLDLLSGLQSRLYDFTRRNKLIYFKETRQSLNLTHASIPLSLTESSVDLNRMIIWNEKLKGSATELKSFNLSDFLLLEEFPWITKSLTAIRASSNRDMREYGFSQLRLCIAFLDWYNLKENKDELIHSPLLLIPVSVKKKRGVRDTWAITFQTSEAVVNPALKEYLSQTYDLELPDTVDLETQTLEDFFLTVKSKIKKSEPSISLELIKNPDLQFIHKENQKKVDKYERRTGKSLNLEVGGLMSTEPKPEQGNNQSLYWAVDLTNTTLGNFNYRKMTLVRDYKAIIRDESISENFNQVFSQKPKEELPEAEELSSFEDVFHILPADPTQMTAIEQAQRGISYIIQGPPGTGKSQTISNLIADYTARDKRVLFVCEKRAALDVVYHRLSQAGLKKLCCMIHDSQDDKKEFIKDLKDCYDTLSLEEDTSVSLKRNEVVLELNSVLKEINGYYKHLNTLLTPNETVNDLISRAVEIFEGPDCEIPENEVPDLKEFLDNKLGIEEMHSTLREQLRVNAWKESPFHIIKTDILREADPERVIFDLSSSTLAVLESINHSLKDLSSRHDFTLHEAIEVLELSERILYFSEKNLLFLLDKESHAANSVYKSVATLRGLKTKAENSKEKNLNWKEKLSPEETERAQTIALNTENSFLRFLMPSWWRLRKILNRDYDFSAHKLPPAWSEILKNLAREHKAFERAEAAEKALCSDYNFSDFDNEVNEIDELREIFVKNKIDLSSETFEKSISIWSSLKDQAVIWKELKLKFHSLLYSPDTLEETINALSKLKNNCSKYHLVHPVIEQMAKLPLSVKELIQKHSVDHPALEYTVLSKEINNYLNAHPDFKKFDFKKVETLRKRYFRLQKKFHALNSRYILEKKSGKFSEHLKICNSPAAELTAEQKEFKKTYNRGRKELEHEFGKKMRYKSIRDLAAEDSGEVVRDLKPIWLMSPLSVSDTIPLDEMEFDAVIFDEASQIVVEESIPTLYRSKQFIIVGDEKQLPPTNFFNARSEASESLNILNADSLLSVAALNVPATLLGWHYRSKNEWLISYSNSAFYKRHLLTVPEIKHESSTRSPIEVISTEQGINNYSLIVDRSISFHFMKQGIYENRSNTTEADYIAQMVWEYLRKDEEMTLGIVAFSEAQQDEIESSLEKIAETDEEFRDKLSQAQERIIDGHYEGLFVKNLENVQGDERDIMILSICYGKNSQGKMRMNFGPINQKGGEKRLNVIVTRARRHVAVISSIKGDWITNDYNEGALCFKRYLKYAEAVSSGEIDQAEWLLDSICLADKASSIQKSIYHNYSKSLNFDLIKEQIGSSAFKAPLGIGTDSDGTFKHALLNIGSKKINGSLEMAFMRPALLENFGWKVTEASSKDLYIIPDKVTDNITGNL